MSRARFLTNEMIEKLKFARAGERYDKADGKTPNLFVRIGPRKKVFVLLARFGGARNSTRRTIGEYPEMKIERARVVAAEWNALVDERLDPKMEPARTAAEKRRLARRTFRWVMEDFIVCLPRRQSNRHAQKDIGDIRRNVLECGMAFVEKPIDEVTGVDLQNLIEWIRDRPAPRQAGIIWAHIKDFYGWAMTPSYAAAFGLRSNPTTDVKPKWLGLGTRIRKNTLSPMQLRAFWRATITLGYPMGHCMQFNVLTGAPRRSDAARARWSQIDWTRQLWVAPPGKSDNERPVPLTKETLELLLRMKRTQPLGHGDYIFSTTNGQKPINGFSKSTDNLRREMVLELGKLDPWAKPLTFLIHDTRRVVRTAMAEMDVDPQVAEAIIDHGKLGMERVYNQYTFLRQSRAALCKFTARLMAVVDGSAPGFGDEEDLGVFTIDTSEERS